MRKLLITVLAVVIIIAGTGAAVLYMVGDRIIDQAIDSEIASLEKGLEKDLEASLKDELNGSLEASPGTSPEETTEGSLAEPAGNAQKGSLEDLNAQAGTGTGGTATPVSPDSQGTSTNTSDQSGSGSGQNTASGSKTPTGNNTPVKEQKLQITIDKMVEIKEEVTAADKMSAAALVLKRLSAGDIDKLKAMLSGGVSAQETAAAKDMVYKKFNEEEVREIKEIYRKYMK